MLSSHRVQIVTGWSHFLLVKVKDTYFVLHRRERDKYSIVTDFIYPNTIFYYSYFGEIEITSDKLKIALLSAMPFVIYPKSALPLFSSICRQVVPVKVNLRRVFIKWSMSV